MNYILVECPCFQSIEREVLSNTPIDLMGYLALLHISFICSANDKVLFWLLFSLLLGCLLTIMLRRLKLAC